MLPDYQLLDAVKHNDLAEARDAFDRGANPDAWDFNRLTALQVACTHGHMSMAELLLAQKADLNATFGKRKQALLHWAADHHETVILIDPPDESNPASLQAAEREFQSRPGDRSLF